MTSLVHCFRMSGKASGTRICSAQYNGSTSILTTCLRLSFTRCSSRDGVRCCSLRSTDSCTVGVRCDDRKINHLSSHHHRIITQATSSGATALSQTRQLALLDSPCRSSPTSTVPELRQSPCCLAPALSLPPWPRYAQAVCARAPRAFAHVACSRCGAGVGPGAHAPLRMATGCPCCFGPVDVCCCWRCVCLETGAVAGCVQRLAHLTPLCGCGCSYVQVTTMS